MKAKWLLLAVLIGLTSFFYLKTLPLGLTWENGELYEGRLAQIVAQEGPSALPLSPLHWLLSSFLLKISPQLETLTYLSLTASSLTLLCLGALLYQLTRSLPSALLGVAFLGTHPLYWQYSTNVNVNLTCLTFFGWGNLFLSQALSKKDPTFNWVGAGLGYGMALATFPQASVFVIALVIFNLVSRLPLRVRFYQILGMLLGLLPLISLVVSSPYSLLEGWVAWLQPLDLAPPTLWSRLSQQALLVFSTPTWPLFVFVALGWLWEAPKHLHHDARRFIRFLGATWLLDLLFNGLHATPNQAIYVLPELWLAALLAGLGFDLLARLLIPLVKDHLAVAYENRYWLVIIRSKEKGLFSQGLIYLVLGTLGLLPPLLGAKAIHAVAASGSRDAAELYIEEVIHSASPKALIVSDDQKIAAALAYLALSQPSQGWLAIATDLPFNQSQLDSLRGQFPSLPQEALAPTQQEAGLEALTGFIDEALVSRPVYFAPASRPPPGTEVVWENFKLTSTGPLFKLTRM